MDTGRTTKHSDTAKERSLLFEEIYGVSTINEILELFREDYKSVKNRSLKGVQALFKKYTYAIFYMYSPSTIRTNVVNFKNIIKEEGGKYEANALEAFKIDEVYVPLKKKDAKKKRELKRKVREGESKSQNNNPQIVIDKIKEVRKILIEKKYKVAKNQNALQVRAYHIMVLLGLATGRRATELLKTLKISKRANKCYFDGLLKGNEKIEANIIELSYNETKAYLKQLRKFSKGKDLTESEVNAKYSRVFNDAVKRLFSFKNVKELRHYYSVAGASLFKKENETVEDTISRILGHKEVFTSALNYT
jgi:hypothetical protein